MKCQESVIVVMSTSVGAGTHREPWKWLKEVCILRGMIDRQPTRVFAQSVQLKYIKDGYSGGWGKLSQYRSQSLSTFSHLEQTHWR